VKATVQGDATVIEAELAPRVAFDPNEPVHPSGGAWRPSDHWTIHGFGDDLEWTPRADPGNGYAFPTAPEPVWSISAGAVVGEADYWRSDRQLRITVRPAFSGALRLFLLGGNHGEPYDVTVQEHRGQESFASE
jgi:hypothetical protein